MTEFGASAAAQALRQSVEENRHQVAMTEESRILLVAMMRDEMGDAFAKGLRDAMTSDNARQFVRAMLSEAQTLATEKTGQMVGGAVMALFKRVLLFMFLGSLVYAVGGWSALAALAKFLRE